VLELRDALGAQDVAEALRMELGDRNLLD